VPRPGKILGVGRNYRAHAAEGGLAVQEKPRIFVKLGSSVIGPRAPIPKPAAVTKLDYETELAVIIGESARGVSEAEALRHVAGYTILNDVSARELQFDVSPPQTSFAKSMDGFCPMGPVLATPDEFGDPGDIRLRGFVNGELVQEGSTRDLLFPIPLLIAYLSRYLTLEPGDVIATGTPAGVGAFRNPPRYLEPGDVIRMEIAGIGVLENRVVAAR
jgi:acylpyruvate hydrolase